MNIINTANIECISHTVCRVKQRTEIKF